MIMIMMPWSCQSDHDHDEDDEYGTFADQCVVNLMAFISIIIASDDIRRRAKKEEIMHYHFMIRI